MKRLFSILVIATIMVFGAVDVNATNNVNALPATMMNFVQDEDQAVAEEAEAESAGFHQELKRRFIEGGPGFMGIVLLCLILGLAIAIERIIYLNLATTNTKKLAQDVEDALNTGGIEAAKDVCRNT